eukprot:483482-Alexandrium_andersonii.AAC.1
MQGGCGGIALPWWNDPRASQEPNWLWSKNAQGCVCGINGLSLISCAACAPQPLFPMEEGGSKRSS